MNNTPKPHPQSVQEPSHHQAARALMGKNFLGIPEVSKYFEAITDEQFESLNTIPFPGHMLNLCAESHILVADIGLSMENVLRITPEVQRSNSSNRRKKCPVVYNSTDTWWSRESFATESDSKATWRLIRKSPVENSINKTWQEQSRLIAGSPAEIPSAREMFYTIMLYHLVTQERLFEETTVWTRSISSHETRVYIGSFDDDGMVIYFYGSAPHPTRGLALALPANSA